MVLLRRKNIMVNLVEHKEIKVSKAEIKRVVAQFEKVGAIPSVAFTDKREEVKHYEDRFKKPLWELF